MPSFNVQITNLEQIRSAFKRAPEKMAKNLDLAIRKSVIAIQRQSMINSPVDTGRLRNSHQSLFDVLKGTVQPTANYAIYVHEGTSRMKGRPFLAMAVQSESGNVNKNFQKAVQDTLDEIAKDTR